jgi:hypothetical protein
MNKLKDRSHGEIDQRVLEQRLDSGELGEICVHITSVGHRDESMYLAIRMGLTGSPATSP